MAAEIPCVEPAEFYAGDSVTWKKTDPDYSAAAGWTLKYALVKDDKLIVFSSAASGSEHLVTLAAATTAAYLPGEYSWRSYVEGGTSERYQRGSGVLTVKANYALEAAGFDARSWTKVTLDAIRARLRGDASTAQLSRRVGDLSVGEIPLIELLRTEAGLAARYEREQAEINLAQGRRTKANKIKSRFVG